MSAARLAAVRDAIRDALAADPFARTVTLDFGADGAIHIDGPAGEVRQELAPADCVVRVALEDFIALAKGRLAPARAVLSGRLKLEGDAGLALALAQRLAAARE